MKSKKIIFVERERESEGMLEICENVGYTLLDQWEHLIN